MYIFLIIRRPCTGVAWNPIVPNLLAGAFDKLRGEGSGYIWDVCSKVPDDKEDANILYKLSYDEAASSLSWAPNMDPHILAIGKHQICLQ